MEKENKVKFENITNEQIYEGIVCLAIKLDSLLEIFEKVNKKLDEQG
jgi:hypothetical protein